MLPSAAAVLEDGNLLAEILLRLPPQPSSLPRASMVCKRWCSLTSDPCFSHRFRRHHRRNPPLLGFFRKDGNELRFEPTLEPPNRVSPARFPFPIDTVNRHFMLLGCHHGFLLMLYMSQGTSKLLVWDPFNGHEHSLAIPPGFENKIPHSGAVLRAALGDVQNFQVIVVTTDLDKQIIACVYSSETGLWGNLITTLLPPNDPDTYLAVIDPRLPAVLVGDSLYILFLGKWSSIIEFDVDRQSLAVIPLPVGLDPKFSRYFWVVRAEGGGLGVLFMSTSDCSAQLWKRKNDCDGVASWLLGRTIELDSLLSMELQVHRGLQIEGFAEENNVVFVHVIGGVGVFMIQLDSLQFKKLPQIYLPQCYPFKWFYAAGIETLE